MRKVSSEIDDKMMWNILHRSLVHNHFQNNLSFYPDFLISHVLLFCPPSKSSVVGPCLSMAFNTLYCNLFNYVPSHIECFQCLSGFQGCQENVVELMYSLPTRG